MTSRRILFFDSQFSWSTKVVFAVCSSTANFADELGIFHTRPHLVDTMMFGILAHVFFMISHENLSYNRCSRIL